MMRTLLITRGIPASGKSTWSDQHARKLAEKGLKTVIICKDDIRKQLAETGWKWSHEAEKDVIQERDNRIRAAFGMDADVVIVADTNFGKHKAALQQLAQELRVDFELRDFTHVPLEECLRRDKLREHPVGEKVIRDMYDKYVGLPEIERYIPNHNKPRAVICDLDGTLALFDGMRSPYDTGKCLDDKLNEPIAELVRLLARENQIVYLSGREDKFRDLTKAWLKKQYLPTGPLFMRTTGDHRKDYIVKLEIFNTEIRDRYCPDYVIDDRPSVLRMWGKLGLCTLAVGPLNEF